MVSVRVKDNLGAVIEEYPRCIVAQVVAKPVFGAVVDPLTDPNLVLFGSGLATGSLLDLGRRTRFLSVSEAAGHAPLVLTGPVSVEFVAAVSLSGLDLAGATARNGIYLSMDGRC